MLSWEFATWLTVERDTVDPDGPGALPPAAVQYDAAGNLIVDEDGRTYVYDELNRLIELWSPASPASGAGEEEFVQVIGGGPVLTVPPASHLLVRYTYDAFGRRIRADFDPDVPPIRRAINYYHDGHAVTEERDAIATGEPRLRFHIHGSQYLDEHVATFEDTLVPSSPGDAWRFYLHNDLYTVAGSGNPSGGILDVCQYGTYGLSGVVECATGDVSGDGTLDIGDIPQMVAVLLTATGTQQELCAADTNRDGLPDGDDLPPFVTCLLHGACAGHATQRGGPFALHGQPVDVLSDGKMLQYSRARYLDLRHLRWLQRDPLGYRNGGNLYEAFSGNPTAHVDPMGTDDGSGFWDSLADLLYRYGDPNGRRQTIAEQTGVAPPDPFTQAAHDRERMTIDMLGPPVRTAIELGRQTVVRGMGGLGAVGGAGETYIGVILFVPSLGTSTVFIVHGADVAQAGFWQAQSGEWTPTLTQEAIAAVGYPRVAVVVDLGTSLASGGAGLLSELRAGPASMRAATAIAGEARALSAESTLMLRLQRWLVGTFGAEPGPGVFGAGMVPGGPGPGAPRPIGVGPGSKQLLFPFAQQERQLLFPFAQESAAFGHAASTNYRATFFAAYPEFKGEVIVHHAVPQRTVTLYPSVVTEAQIHSLENLRGVPIDINTEVHLSQIAREWNQFYAANPNPTVAQLLQKASEIDARYGSRFRPQLGRGG